MSESLELKNEELFLDQSEIKLLKLICAAMFSVSRDLYRPKPKKPVGRPKGSADERLVRIRKKYLEEYEAKYSGSIGLWGARANGQAKNLLRDATEDEVLHLISMYFRWRKPEVIRSGHPFCGGRGSFCSMYSELRADAYGDASVRHREAYSAQARERVMQNMVHDEVRQSIESEQIQKRVTEKLHGSSETQKLSAFNDQ